MVLQFSLIAVLSDYTRGDEHAARKRISCGPRSIQARPTVLNFRIQARPAVLN